MKTDKKARREMIKEEVRDLVSSFRWKTSVLGRKFQARNEHGPLKKLTNMQLTIMVKAARQIEDLSLAAAMILMQRRANMLRSRRLQDDAKRFYEVRQAAERRRRAKMLI